MKKYFQLQFLFFNFFVSLLICLRYINFSSSLFANIYSIIMLISNTVMLYIPLLILLTIISVILQRKYPQAIVSVILLISFQILLFIDATIYSIYRFHINGAVLTIFTAGGFGNSVKIGWFSTVLFFLLVAVLMFVEFFIFINIYNKNHRRTYFNKSSFSYKIVFLILVFIILLDKGIFAVADLYNKVPILLNAKSFPFYQPLTIKRLMEKRFNFVVNREENFKVANDNKILKYPKKELNVQGENKPNVLIIISDAWRWDMLNDSVTPNIYEFSKISQNYKNHYSGGNASRFGIFTLFYGISGNYWHNILAQRQSPILINEFKKLGYDFFIASSTSLTYPEFRKTSFINIPEYIYDEIDGVDASEKDPKLAQMFIEYLKKEDPKKRKPFFSFLYFDSPHSKEYPTEYEKFTPSKKSVNYLKINNNKSNIEKMLNSYRNSIHFNDDLIGKIIKQLKLGDYLKNTIVIITADHGEEYYETGFFGHTSSFSDYQTKIPLILYTPTIQPKNIKKLTSSVDIVPTLMEIIGVQNSPSDYSNGFSLLSNKRRSFVISSGWDNSAIITEKNYFIFSTETYNIGAFEVRDSDYKMINDYKSVLKNNKEIILDAMLKLSEF